MWAEASLISSPGLAGRWVVEYYGVKSTSATTGASWRVSRAGRHWGASTLAAEIGGEGGQGCLVDVAAWAIDGYEVRSMGDWRYIVSRYSNFVVLY